MSRSMRVSLSIQAGLLMVLAHPHARVAAQVSSSFGSAAAPAPARGGFAAPAYSYFYPSFGGGYFGGYFSPFLELPWSPPAPYPYLPKYWWTGMYSEADPRQDGYNPSAGYTWDSVGTLMLLTYPTKARITLDGTFIGTTNYLGPIQLPLGEHTLRVEAAGYEPSETVLKVDQARPEELEIRLKPLKSSVATDSRP